MSLPGLGLSDDTLDLSPSEALPENRTIDLQPATEWRFEVALDTRVTVRITSSSPPTTIEDSPAPLAEIFGTELVPDADYSFSGTKAAIYTHDGCRLSITGTCESDYVADETPMVTYMNVHFALENLRSTIAAARARAPEGEETVVGGPRVLILGPDNAGKTSLIKMLTTYATRAERSPAVVNLDPREGMFCLPGSVSAAVFGAGSQMDVESAGNNGWGSSPVQGADALQSHMPIVYHYGFEKVEEAPEMFKPVASRLALAVTSRFEEDEAVKEAGIFVDLAGTACSSGKKGYDIIHHVVSEFSINIILVLGSERLYSDLSRKYPPQPTTNGASTSKPQQQPSIPTETHPLLLKLPKSGGTVDRDAEHLAAQRTEAVREYFYGNSRRLGGGLSPHSVTVGLADLKVLRVLDEDSADLSTAFLPGGSSSTNNPTQTKQIYAAPSPLNLSALSTLLTIKHASASDAHDVIRDAPVMGYLYVAEVDVDRKRVRVLSPVGGRVPDRAVLWGGWPEGVGDIG